MAKITYSKDLRERVIDHIKSGNSQRSTSDLFRISTSAVSSWWMRYIKEGNANPRKLGGSVGKIDEELLAKMVEENCDQRLSEIGKMFNVTASAISQKLNKLGFSYKKKPSPTWKRAKRNEMST